MHSFFVKTLNAPGEVQILDKREAEHLFKILRGRPGDAVELLDGCGGVAQSRITEHKEVEILSRTFQEQPPLLLHIYTALPRAGKLDLLLKPLAEIGAWKITPLICQRSVATPERPGSRWTLLLQEGCKQSKNPFLPQIEAVRTLGEVLKEFPTAGENGFFGDVRGCTNLHTISSIALQQNPEQRRILSWFIGPEGGFTDEEELAMRHAGIRGIRLGNYVLRLETAAVAGALALWNAFADDADASATGDAER